MQSFLASLKANLQPFAWTLTIAVNLLALFIWGQYIDWDFDSISTYSLFPLLGLVAFSTMWAQYVAGAARRLTGADPATLAAFSNNTGYIATIAILLHPGLLGWQLWRDGLGLPPASFRNFVADSAAWALLLGLISFIAFLAFELRHRYSGRSWWKYVNYANDAAIIAIYVHALRLGSHIDDWFYAVWILYGLVLAAVLLHKYSQRTT